MKDKIKPDKKLRDELKGIEAKMQSKNTDLLQCPRCYILHDRYIEHKCVERNFWASVCIICNRDLHKWKEDKRGPYVKWVDLRKSVRLYNKPVCESCVIDLDNLLSKKKK